LQGFFLHHQVARNQNKPSGSELHESGLQEKKMIKCFHKKLNKTLENP
jgi:hypothetical protein